MDKRYIHKALKDFKKNRHCLVPVGAQNIKFKCLKNCGFICCNLPVILKAGIWRNRDDLRKNCQKSKFKNGLFELKRKNSQCIFLDDNGLCEIYRNRPLACKVYPFFQSPLSGEIFYDQLCPGIGRGKNVDLIKIRKLRECFWAELHLTQQEKKTLHNLLFS